MKRRLQLPPEIEELLFSICEKFVNGEKASAIAEWVQAELKEKKVDIAFTREQVYPLLAEAQQRGYIRLCPPEDRSLAQRIGDRYHLDKDRLKIVNARGKHRADYVTAAAADLAITLIGEVARRKRAKRKKPAKEATGEEVHLGLGSGWTTMHVAKHLGQGLRSAFPLIGEVSKLVVHALTSGFQVDEPETASVAFLSFFNDAVIDVKYVGLFAQAMVRQHEYESVKDSIGVRESFQQAGEIDIVFSSLASARDSNGLLNRFIAYDPPGKKLLEQNGWIGDVQYQPYSATGPIKVGTGIRAVTLFDLEDLVRMAKGPDKVVVLVSGPTRDGGTRSDALIPLLKEPSLRVWSYLVTDVPTARELVSPENPASTADDA